MQVLRNRAGNYTVHTATDSYHVTYYNDRRWKISNYLCSPPRVEWATSLHEAKAVIASRGLRPETTVLAYPQNRTIRIYFTADTGLTADWPLSYVEIYRDLARDTLPVEELLYYACAVCNTLKACQMVADLPFAARSVGNLIELPLETVVAYYRVTKDGFTLVRTADAIAELGLLNGRRLRLHRPN